MDIKPGDYLLSRENELFRIVDVYKDATDTYYDIKSLKTTKNADILGVKYVQGVPRNVLRHMGTLIKEENITKTHRILYG